MELDEPQLITYKNDKLPVSECKNKLQRIPIHFATESLHEKLNGIRKHDAVAIVVEGVLMYLNTSLISDLLLTLGKVFPEHRLFCDLMTAKFFQKYSYKIHEKIKSLGTSFSIISDDPVSLFTSKGYQLLGRISTVQKAVELKVLNIPLFVLRWFMPTLLEGYAVYSFEKNNL